EGSKPSESEAGDPQASESESAAESSAEATASATDSGEQSAGSDQGMTTGGSSGKESSPDALEMFNLKRLDLPRQRRVRKQGGKRSASQTADRRGRYVRAEPKAKVNDLAIDATVRAAAPMQKDRGRLDGERLKLERPDLRQKVRERKVGNLIVFVVDASASMDAEQRMAATKGALLSLLQDAYVRVGEGPGLDLGCEGARRPHHLLSQLGIALHEAGPDRGRGGVGRQDAGHPAPRAARRS